MNINKINSSPNFSAKWSNKTLALADKMDKENSTNFRQQLEEALEANTELRNYGGDEVLLSLSTIPYVNDKREICQIYTAQLTQDFNGHKINALITPRRPLRYCSYKATYSQLDDRYVLYYISDNKTAQKQIVDAVANSRNFKAGFINGLASFFLQSSKLNDNEKSKIFDEFFSSK